MSLRLLSLPGCNNINNNTRSIQIIKLHIVMWYLLIILLVIIANFMQFQFYDYDFKI